MYIFWNFKSQYFIFNAYDNKFTDGTIIRYLMNFGELSYEFSQNPFPYIQYRFKVAYKEG